MMTYKIKMRKCWLGIKTKKNCTPNRTEPFWNVLSSALKLFDVTRNIWLKTSNNFYATMYFSQRLDLFFPRVEPRLMHRTPLAFNVTPKSVPKRPPYCHFINQKATTQTPRCLRFGFFQGARKPNTTAIPNWEHLMPYESNRSQRPVT